jgi:multidrug efflux pump subunit AcrA (membrane-fusion protein)
MSGSFYPGLSVYSNHTTGLYLIMGVPDNRLFCCAFNNCLANRLRWRALAGMGFAVFSWPHILSGQSRRCCTNGYIFHEFWRYVWRHLPHYQTTPAARGNIEATVGATGTVRANQTALLTWQTTGSVEAVRVTVGDNVRADDILAELSKTSLSQSIILAEVDLLTAQRTLEDLKTSGTSRAQAELAVVQAEKALSDAKTRYEGVNFARASDTKIDNVQSEIDLLDNQISQARRFYDQVATCPMAILAKPRLYRT